MTAIPSSRLITVFGGSGFLGRHTVRALANDGWRIRVAVRRPALAHFLTPMGRVGQIQIVKTNICDDAQTAAALHGAQAAINLVGLLVQSGSQRFDAIHVGAAGRIARLAKEAGVARVVHISAIGADADAPARYFRTKAEGEAYVREIYPQAAIVRPAVMFGPEDNFFNKFAWLARYFPVLPLFGGGRTKFQPVFVVDVAAALARIVQDPVAEGRTYELAGPEIMTFKDVLQLVLRATHRKRWLMPYPLALARIKGAFLQFLPKPLITADQMRMLETDTIAQGSAPGLASLGIIPSAPEAIVPTYLWRFRREGQFETVAP